jgi:hypothetical protein
VEYSNQDGLLIWTIPILAVRRLDLT